jgi:hypothetical protein
MLTAWSMIWSVCIAVFCTFFFMSGLCFTAIVLSVLRYTDSDYPFGIFKLFLRLTAVSMLTFVSMLTGKM